MIEEGLVAFLKADVPISTLIADRVYSFQLPQNPLYPAVTYSRDSTQRHTIMEGQSNYVGADIQIDAWATSYAAAKLLQKTIRDAINNFRGMMGTVHVDQIRIITDAPDLYEEEVQKYRCSTVYTVWHNE